MSKNVLTLTKAQVILLRRICAWKANPIKCTTDLNQLVIEIKDIFGERVHRGTLLVLIRRSVVRYSYTNTCFVPTDIGIKLADLGNGNPAYIQANLPKDNGYLNKDSRRKLK